MEQFLTAGGSIALVKSVVDLVKYFRAGDTNGWVTQFVVWLAGIGVVLLVKWSDVASSFPVGTTTLEFAKGGTIVLAGLGLGSAAMLTNSTIKAVDQHQTAATPALVDAPRNEVVVTTI